ncbi:hypothetical protein NDU88_004831 [Pleurodeles waltl]|uniref:Uncharacterized protein n=1 Tax=Pleurodeles waltl TaxID=8319 RepID=A0AAV7UI46_PLEWA|nr:hypothetical protein NDU88_004831 [Pleurodeles waltl]
MAPPQRRGQKKERKKEPEEEFNNERLVEKESRYGGRPETRKVAGNRLPKTRVENEPGDCELRSVACAVHFGLAGRGVPPADSDLQCSAGGDSSAWRLRAAPDAAETGRLRQPERSRELGLLHDTPDWRRE